MGLIIRPREGKPNGDRWPISSCSSRPPVGTPHEGWDATSPGDVRGNAGLVSGEVEEVAGALSSTLRCTDRAGTTGRGHWPGHRRARYRQQRGK